MTTLPLIPELPVEGELQLYPFQLAAFEDTRVAARAGHRRQILCAPTGAGKCHPSGTRVLTWDGYAMRVEDVQPGTVLMGPDSQPRWVNSVSRGHGEIVEVVPTKGEPWRCNLDHVLTLVRTNDGRSSRLDGQVVDVSVREWLNWSKTRKHLHKLFRVEVEFPDYVQESLPVEPYLLGLLLGDGSLTRGVTSICNPDPEVIQYCHEAARAWGLQLTQDSSPNRAPSYTFSQGRSRGAENPLTGALRGLGVHGDRAEMKHVPESYRVAPRNDRLELLAGLLDTDGHLAKGYFDFVSASEDLADDVAFIARSLGLAAYVSPCQKSISGTDFTGDYFRVSISGHVDVIPTRVRRKQAAPRLQKKDVLRTGFTIRPFGEDEYYGFTLSGDGRYLLADFTVTHNTECAIALMQEALERGSRVAFVADSIPLVDQTSQRLRSYGIPHGVAQGQKNTHGRYERVQVWSAQTAQARNLITSDLDMVIFDECHIRWTKLMKAALEADLYVLGLSATPLTKRLGDYYTHVTNAVTTDWLLSNVNPLTDKPYLAPLRIYSGVATTEIDMEGAETGKDGEYTARAVRERGRVVIGDVVSEWDRMCREHFGRWVKTLVFSADIPHGEELCAAFQDIGADARQSTYRDSDETTKALVEGFGRQDFDVLVSVAKFVKGFDDPTVLCLVDVRKNRTSLAEVVQKMGRAMRSAPGKEYALYLDHVRNMEDWYYRVLDVWENGVNELHSGKDQTPRPKQTSLEERPDVACYGCGLVLLPSMETCPSCGRERPSPPTDAVTVPGQLQEFTQPGSREWMKDEDWVWAHLSRLALERTDGNVDKAQKKAGGYYKGFYGRWPKWGRELQPCDGPVDPRVVRRVQHNIIKFVKSKEKEAA